MRGWSRAAAYLALALIWGSVWITNDLIRVPPLRASSIRFLGGALLLAVPAWWGRGRGGTREKFAAILRPSLVLAVTMVALPYVLLVWAAQRSSAAWGVALFAWLPVVAAFGMRRMLPVRVPRAVFEAGLIGAGGVALIVFDRLSFSGRDAAAVVAIVVAVASHGGSLVYAKRALRQGSLAAATAVQLGVAAVVVFLSSVMLERNDPSAWSEGTVVVLAATGIAGAGGLLLYYWLLRELEPYQAATLQWTAPLVAIAEGAAAMRGWPPWSVVLGALVVIICTIVTLKISGGDDEAVTLLVTSGPSGEAQEKLR